MKERPILFSGPMVRAILDRLKTQTRRVIKRQPDGRYDAKMGKVVCFDEPGELWWSRGGINGLPKCPYGTVGDRMWIKTGYRTRYDADRNETYWSIDSAFITTHGRPLSKSGRQKKDGGHPGMFMPYWLSCGLHLPLLEITDVRVQRLKEISEEDAKAEGVKASDESDGLYSYVGGFCQLWNSLNDKPCKTCRGQGVVASWAGSLHDGTLMRDAEDCPTCGGRENPNCWDANPWVWAITFKAVKNGEA